MKEITPPEGNATIGIPLVEKVSKCDKGQEEREYLFGLKKVLGVGEQHFFNAGVEDDRRDGPLVSRVGPSPAPMRVGEVDLYPVHGLGLVLLFSLENELLED